MTTFLLLAAVLGLPMVWAISSSSRRSYRDYDDEWDDRYPPQYPPYPYPPYPPYPPYRRREPQAPMTLLTLLLIIVLAFIVVRYIYEKEEVKKFEKENDQNWNGSGAGVYKIEDEIDDVGGEGKGRLIYTESTQERSAEEAAQQWFSQAGQYRTEARAREQIEKLRGKYSGKLWLGINYGMDDQPYKVLIGPFASEYEAREALKGDYPVRRPAQENIEIRRAE